MKEILQPHWCRVEGCIHHGSYSGEDAEGRFWECPTEVTINRDGVCEDKVITDGR